MVGEFFHGGAKGSTSQKLSGTGSFLIAVKLYGSSVSDRIFACAWCWTRANPLTSQLNRLEPGEIVSVPFLSSR